MLFRSSLDIITEIKILKLLKELKNRLNLSIILITHNISLVENFADTVAIMYAGRIIEKGTKQEILHSPKHPYAKALLDCLPKKDKQLNTIKGNVPNLANLPSGCKFNPRCPHVMKRCLEEEPEFTEITQEHSVKCYLLQKT